MKKYLTGLAVCAIMNAGLESEAEAVPYSWFTFNGHEYSLTSQWQSWDENQNEAVSQGGYLAVINSNEENTWLTHAFAYTFQQDGPWNGGDVGWKSLVNIGYYKSSDGTWKWINGETGVDNPSQFYYSHPLGSPIPGTKAYLHVEGHYFAGTWNSAVYVTGPTDFGYEPAFGIIERSTPVPDNQTGVGILVSIGLGFLGWLRRYGLGRPKGSS
jgi:hypothetical protein